MKASLPLIAAFAVAFAVVGLGGYLLGSRDAAPLPSTPRPVDLEAAPARPAPASSTTVARPVTPIQPTNSAQPPATPLPGNAAPRPVAISTVAPPPPAPRPTPQAVVAAGIPSGSAPTSLSPEEPIAATTDEPLGEARPVNPRAPGNTFAYRGVRVAVAETYAVFGGNGTALGIDVTPEAAGNLPDAGTETSPLGSDPGTTGQTNKRTGDSSGSGDGGSGGPTAGTTPQPASPGINPSPSPSSTGTLSREEQLFRMKWGWAAYDAAQREAARDAANQAAGTNP